MKVALITASTLEGEPDLDPGAPLDEDPPLGILSVAAAIRRDGHEPVVCDLTQFLRESPGGDACHAAAEWIHAVDADVYGFGTICSSYPITLRIAQDVRRRAPDAAIVLGGPQATVTDQLVVEAFRCVDIVVRGEGEYVFPEVLHALADEGRLHDIPGITYRVNGAVARNPDAPIIADLDSLPDPAYELDPLMRRRLFASVELGRGCPFACEFCSTNDFFRRKFRLKSPQRVVAQMQRVRDLYGHDRFGLVHDMFTVDRRKVLAFCDEVIRAGAGLRWSCSARTDCVDEELLDRMAEAGCVGLFFGIESGAPSLQRRMGKDLDLDEARRMIAAASRRGMSTTVSTIVGFPEETHDELRQTAAFVMDVVRDDRAEPQVHLLAPLAGTPLARRCRESLRLQHGTYSDASGSPVGRDHASPEQALIAAFPDLFTNFYLLPTLIPIRYLTEARFFLARGLRRCRWLMVALDQEAGHILDVFDRWMTWRQPPADLERYYLDQAFVREFLHFTRVTYANRGLGATDVLLRYFEGILQVQPSLPDSTLDAPAPDYRDDVIPVLAPNSRLLRMTGSVPTVLEDLRARRRPLPQDVARPVDLFVRRLPPRWYQVSELPPLSATILSWCDGARRAADIIERFTASDLQFAEAPPDRVCRHALRYLSTQGFLRFVATR